MRPSLSVSRLFHESLHIQLPIHCDVVSVKYFVTLGKETKTRAKPSSSHIIAFFFYHFLKEETDTCA